MNLTSWYPSSYVKPSLWIWSGPSGSLLMDRIWQKWWDATTEIRLQRDWCPSWACSLPHKLWGKTGAVLGAALWRGPCDNELLSLAQSQGGPTTASSCVSDSEAHPPLHKPLDDPSSCSLVRDPEQEASAKLCLDCWPTEVICCFKLLSLG